MRHRLALLVVFALFLFPLAAIAAELPALTGRVVDNADMIDGSTRQSLVSRLEAFETKTSVQVVIISSNSETAKALTAATPDVDLFAERIQTLAHREGWSMVNKS